VCGLLYAGGEGHGSPHLQLQLGGQGLHTQLRGPLLSIPPTHPGLFCFVPDTELLGMVEEPAYELEEAVKIFEINYINYITVDFPALRLNVFKDK
jgi:hypothetical protein